MNKGLIRTVLPLVILLLPVAAFAEGEIYKVVDKDGNVIYTDQRPSAEAEPMDLPELSVIKSDVPPPAPAAAPVAEEQEQAEAPTARALRKLYADFRITQPQQDETFWGTENTVVVAWGSAQPIPPEMAVKLYVDGAAQDVVGNGSVSLTLDRGEHTVYAELLDARKRRIVTTETVTFFVKQHSVNFNGPGVAPRITGR
jgi:hypothetical protein